MVRSAPLLLAGSAALMACCSINEAAAQAGLPFESLYATSYGTMAFAGSPGAVSGTYNEDDGTISGTLADRVLSGYWTEGSSARECGSARNGQQYWGRIRFEFSEDFREFNGQWSYCDEPLDGGWNGQLAALSPEASVPELPAYEEAMADACPFIEISDPPAPDVPVAGELVPYSEGYFPAFVGKPWVNDAVAKWRGIVGQLATHMAEKPGRDRLQQLLRWEAQRVSLLGELVLAEEDVVWKLPGSQFTTGEIDTLRPAFVRLSRAREQAERLAQNEVKVAALYETLASYEEFYNTIQKRFTTGDQDFFLAAALSMAHAQCSDRLRGVEGVSDALRREITGAITELSTAFAQVVQSRRNRGLEELDRLRAEQAAAAGNPSPPPFRMHRPATRKEYDDLARIMSEQFGELVSGGVPMQFPASSSRAFFDLPRDRVTELTQGEIDRMTR